MLKYFAIGLLLIVSSTIADEDMFSQPVDFKHLAAGANKGNMPIMVLFSSQYCVYCEFIKREYLSPMIRSGEYTDKTIISVVETDEEDEVQDFNGKLIDVDTFTERYDIQFIPTVVFLDSRGKEISERIVGLGNEDYYGGVLDEGITASQASINIRRKQVVQ